MSAYICQECVELCSSIFQHQKMLGDAAEHAASQFNPYCDADEAEAEQAAADPFKPSFEDTCDAATEILRRLMEQKRALLDASPSILTSLEDDIIRLRWGLIDGYDYRLEQVGEKFGMAPERVAEIEARAEAKLRLAAPQA
jgi:RNA polymerase primary sigma factor